MKSKIFFFAMSLVFCAAATVPLRSPKDAANQSGRRMLRYALVDTNPIVITSLVGYDTNWNVIWQWTNTATPRQLRKHEK